MVFYGLIQTAVCWADLDCTNQEEHINLILNLELLKQSFKVYEYRIEEYRMNELKWLNFTVQYNLIV